MKRLLIWLKKPRLFQRILKKITKIFFFEQWILLYATESNDKFNWKNFKPILPPRGQFWADPFIWVREGSYYIFYEEFFLSNFRGRISCLALDEEMQITSNLPVLEKPYHLSYPFLFEYESQLYMLPETKESGRIELYQCTHFPVVSQSSVVSSW